ncbi:DedA family protein [Rhodobacteraceae bacterium]|nr:DedA family protein [Paracoccaceae bacterium]
MTVDHLISHYGLWAIFAGCFLEGETVAITGGLFAHRHLLVLWQVALTAGVAAFCSDMLIFGLGRRFQSHARVRKIMARAAVAGVMTRIERNPGLFASVFRFIPGMRIIGPLALAQSRLKGAEFALRAGLSAGLWAVFFTTAGHVVGGCIALVFGHIHRTEVLFLVPLAIAATLGALFLWHRIRHAKR